MTSKRPREAIFEREGYCITRASSGTLFLYVLNSNVMVFKIVAKHTFTGSCLGMFTLIPV